MSDSPGREPIVRRRLRGNELTALSPFGRLCVTHGFSVSADTLLTIALANSIFFASAGSDSARSRVLASLVLTMAPFAVVAPFLGPLLDRFAGARKLMVTGSAVLRGIVCIMLSGIVTDKGNLQVYPLVFVALVLSKAYHVSRSALVPSSVEREVDLVHANSKLALVGGISGFITLVPGGLISLLGSSWVLRLAVGVYIAAAISSIRIVQRPLSNVASIEVVAPSRSSAVVTAAVAMAGMRLVVGFLAFLIAFEYRTGYGKTSGTFVIGVALAASAVGTFLGNFITPRFSEDFEREKILEATLGAACVSMLIGAMIDGIPASVLTAFCIGFCGAAMRLGFDALVQRDTPDAQRARYFAKFEAGFQVAWVFGAVVPVVIPFSLGAGLIFLSLVCASVLGAYLFGRRRIERLAAAGFVVKPTLEGAYPEIARMRLGVAKAARVSMRRLSREGRIQSIEFNQVPPHKSAIQDPLPLFGENSSGTHKSVRNAHTDGFIVDSNSVDAVTLQRTDFNDDLINNNPVADSESGGNVVNDPDRTAKSVWLVDEDE